MILVAHRSGRGEAPENGLSGFLDCLEAGIQCFELDLRLSADHDLMVIHDSTIQRVTGRGGSVAQSQSSTLRKQPILPARRLTRAGEGNLISLEDLLPGLERADHCQLELKSVGRQAAKILCLKLWQFLSRHALLDHVTVTSFDRRLLTLMRAHSATLSLGVVTHQPLLNAAGDDLSDPLKRDIEALRADWLIPHHRQVTANAVNIAHHAGLQVSTWTVNEPARARELAGMGVNSLITDYPHRLRRALA